MRISLVQTSLTWENKDQNLTHIEKKLEQVIGKTDIVLLPEMFSTGFSMDSQKIAEAANGSVAIWMKKWAKKINAVLLGTYAVEEDGAFYNRLSWVFPDGTILKYDKKHLFTYAKEHEAYKAGSETLLVEWRGWKICPLICYDLRFPAWSRNKTGYDLLIYVANWPKPRIKHWDRLLAARAIENQCYVAAVNIVGQDGNGLEYVGHSQVVDFGGDAILFLANQEAIATATVDKNALDTYRNQYNFLADQDTFSIA